MEEYKSICKCSECENIFKDVLDVEKKENVEEKIKYGIQEYIKIKNCEVFEIFENRQLLKELIKFLKINHKIKYIETQSFFEIKKGTMEGLKIYKKEETIN